MTWSPSPISYQRLTCQQETDAAIRRCRALFSEPILIIVCPSQPAPTLIRSGIAPLRHAHCVLCVPRHRHITYPYPAPHFTSRNYPGEVVKHEITSCARHYFGEAPTPRSLSEGGPILLVFLQIRYIYRILHLVEPFTRMLQSTNYIFF